jgi:hypothetical protein
MPEQIEDALDVLHGVKEIAAFLRLPAHKAHYQIAKGWWPVIRRGKLILARKSELAAAASISKPLEDGARK